ncbi:MAG TPA: DNA polymerase III subunit beta [Gemmataceae bacterium]|nr:DNA polymerase III subunit beta [Gemmataceae bacterium]
MKAVCYREGLLSAFQLASVAIPARDVKPILRNVKAIAEDGRCTLMATDLELGIRLEVRGLEVLEPGEAILPASRFVAILREAQAEQITIEADANACKVSGPGMEFEMPSEDPANFPDLPTFTDDRYHEIASGPLREMIRRTVFAAASESARYSMTGVLWELEDSLVRLVATDGKRLALMEGAAKEHGGHTTKGQTPVVPTKAMNILDRNLDEEDSQVKVCLRPNEVLFSTDTAVIYSRLVEGRYPNYRDVFPKKPTTKVPLIVTPFLSAVRQAAIMTEEDSKRVVFHFGKKKLTMEAQGVATGRSKVELPLEYDGKALDISFNPAFLVEMLKVLPGDGALTLEMIDGASPALFKFDANYSYLVMPLT